MTKGIVISGQAAEGSGAIVGWHGQGALTRAEILEALDAAECPAAWAPAARSCKAHAGQAIRRLDNLGFIVRAARRTDTDRAIERATGRTWEARWIVARSLASTAQVGQAGSDVVLAVELRDGELSFEGAESTAGEVGAIFRALRDAESYQAGDVTTWLARVLIGELGATRFGLGYYVPAGSRVQANRLASAMMIRWGRAWICPLLPVATSEELKVGIARGLEDDVRAIAATIARENETARAANRTEMSPATAARLLRSLGEVSERVATYRVLCGGAVDGAVRLLATLIADLGLIADATSQRAALIEMDGPIVDPIVEISPAERAADAALERRHAASVASYQEMLDADLAERAAGSATPQTRRRLRDEQATPRPPRTSALPSNAAIATRRDTYRVPAPPTVVDADLSPDERAPLELD